MTESLENIKKIPSQNLSEMVRKRILNPSSPGALSAPSENTALMISLVNGSSMSIIGDRDIIG